MLFLSRMVLPAVLYSNRAQCHLNNADWHSALSDCNEAMARCLEGAFVVLIHLVKNIVMDIFLSLKCNVIQFCKHSKLILEIAMLLLDCFSLKSNDLKQQACKKPCQDKFRQAT